MALVTVSLAVLVAEEMENEGRDDRKMANALSSSSSSLVFLLLDYSRGLCREENEIK